VPWAALEPRPALLEWLDRDPPVHGAAALVVACGLGDDAEELASDRGHRRHGRAGGKLFVRAAMRGESDPAPHRPCP